MAASYQNLGPDPSTVVPKITDAQRLLTRLERVGYAVEIA
jgi:hypothetical protein